MNSFKRLHSWIMTKLPATCRYSGTRHERVFQGIIAQCGWTVDGFDNDRVFFQATHKGQQFCACLAVQHNGLVSACILGRVAVFDSILNDTRKLFDGFNANPQRPFVHSLLPHSDRHHHAVTWTTRYARLDTKTLRKIIPDLVLSCVCTDQFALDMYRLGLIQETNSADAKRPSRPNSQHG